jgi:Na+/H+ antiporter NhaD/arsenite permease-like protein
MVMTGSLSRAETAAALGFSTLAVLYGMMVLLTVLMRSGLPTWLALNAMSRCRSPHALLALVVFSTVVASVVMLLVTPPAIKWSLQCATHRSGAARLRILGEGRKE